MYPLVMMFMKSNSNNLSQTGGQWQLAGGSKSGSSSRQPAVGSRFMDEDWDCYLLRR